jgi:hypothetical protein
MNKPNILEIKTLKKFSVRKQFVVEVGVEIYAESEYEAEQIANEKLTPIEYTDSVGFDYDADYLDAHGYCPLMDNVEIYSVWQHSSPTQETIFTEDLFDSVTLHQCEEDEGDDNTDTLFVNEEDAIDYWNDYHKTEEDEED